MSGSGPAEALLASLAGLLGAIVHGVIIERYLLRFGRVADASPGEIVDLLRPCFQLLAASPGVVEEVEEDRR